MKPEVILSYTDKYRKVVYLLVTTDMLSSAAFFFELASAAINSLFTSIVIR